VVVQKGIRFLQNWCFRFVQYGRDLRLGGNADEVLPQVIRVTDGRGLSSVGMWPVLILHPVETTA
jgi:hypothetical protein